MHNIELIVDISSMKNYICFECGNPADVNHHVVPKSKGGTQTVPLCWECHSLVHDTKLTANGELIKNAKKRSKANNSRQKIETLFSEGKGVSAIAKEIGMSRESVYNTLEKAGLHINEGKGCETSVTTDTLDKIKALREQGKTWAEIEDEADICHTHLFRIIKEFGFVKGEYGGTSKNRTSYRTMTDDMIQQAKSYRSEGKSWEDIATLLGVERTTLYRHGVHEGTKPIRSQLTPEKSERALALKSEGKTWKEIALEIGVSLRTIYSNNLHKGRLL